MGYNIYITKQTFKENEKGLISQQDWIDYVSTDDNMHWLEELPNDKIYYGDLTNLPPKTTALWFSNPNSKIADLCFTLEDDGKIVFGFGDDEMLLIKIINVARHLGGFVQADDGRIINENYFDMI